MANNFHSRFNLLLTFCTNTILTNFLLLLLLYYHLLQHYCSATEFQVGEIPGWTVPPHNDPQFYNRWASTKRFQITDTLRFNYYKKDSVMEVSKSDYNACNSTRPAFFSNNGNTIYNLTRSGFYYFISGTAGHCDKGQRMVLWVITQDHAISHSHTTSGASARYNRVFSVMPLGLLLLL